MITLTPPAGGRRFTQIKLHSGATVFPDFSAGGCVKVDDRVDAEELIAAGWRLDGKSEKAARFNEQLLRKAAAAHMRHTPGVGESFESDREQNDATLAEFSLKIGSEKVRVKRTDQTIVVAGIEVPLGDLAPQVRRQLSIATAQLDGASFDLDGDLAGLQEAREAIGAAIVAVTMDRAFRDRLITAGSRRVGVTRS
jgi:hypothetical protein